MAEPDPKKGGLSREDMAEPDSKKQETKAPDPNLLRFYGEVIERLDQVRNVEKVLKLSAQLALECFGADEVCVAVLSRTGGAPQLHHTRPEDAEWEAGMFEDFLDGGRPRVPHNILLARIDRRDRPWAALGLRRKSRDFNRSDLQSLAKAANAVSRLIHRIDGIRIADARFRIDRKILEQLQPRDLFYQILHSLKTLTRYDHSAAILIYEGGDDPGALKLVAEQIAWRKGKSRNIGAYAWLTEETRTLLETGEIFGFDNAGGAWREWRGRRAGELAGILTAGKTGSETGDELPVRSILCAPLTTMDGVLGVLKVAATRKGILGLYEMDLVDRFVPEAAIAIRNLKRTEQLESGMLEAEKKHVVADLARGVAHDINNALGAALPLVQQVQADITDSSTNPEDLQEDLSEIENSIEVCRRIFSGMLSFSRNAAGPGEEGIVELAVDHVLTVLRESINRLGIKLDAQVQKNLPAVRGSQGELEQLILNLASNARDAMGDGGTLSINSRLLNGSVEIVVGDTGDGIPPELLSRIQEPFFTTKRRGEGLGLAIVRSMVRKMNGRLFFDSAPGEGTRVVLLLPAAGSSEGGKDD